MIPERLQQSLRQQFNPDGSTRRAHQLRMLELLRYIDGVCRDNDIDYWLSSGTLLGAVRHGGFIPWDDDVDIEMPENDYHRLVGILRRAAGPYILQDSSTDAGFLFPFAKLRDTRSTIREADGLDAGQRFSGVYVDIFRLAPSRSRWLHHLSSRMLGTELKLRLRYGASSAVARALRPLLHGLIFPLIRAVDGLGHPALLRHTVPSYFLAPRHRSDLFPLSEIDFEGISLKAPRDCDAYLSRLYGNYMSIPDPDRIQVHTSDVKLW